MDARRQARRHDRPGPHLPAGPGAARRSPASTPDGLTLPDGVYVPVVHLGSDAPDDHAPEPDPDRHEAAAVDPVSATASTRTSRPTATATRRLPRPLHARASRRTAILLVDGTGRSSSRAARSCAGVLTWNGKIDGRACSAREPRARDLRRRTRPATARSRSRSRSSRSATSSSRGRGSSSRPGARFAVRVLADAPTVSWLLHGAARDRARRDAPPARPEEARRLPALRHRGEPCREGARGRRVTAELARVGGADRRARARAADPRPDRRSSDRRARRLGRRLRRRSRSGSPRRATTAPSPPRPSSASSPPSLLAWLFVRVPWLLAGRRARVRAGADPRLGRRDEGEPAAADVRRRRRRPRSRSPGSSSGTTRRARELGPLAWPLALFVGWTGLDVRSGRSTARDGRDLPALLRAPVRAARGLARAAAVADRLGEGALRRSSRRWRSCSPRSASGST